MVIQSIEKTYEVVRQLDTDVFVSHYLCKEDGDEKELRIVVQIKADEVTKPLILQITECADNPAFFDFRENFSYDGNVYGVFLYQEGTLLKEGLESGSLNTSFRYELGRKILEKLIVQNIPASLVGRLLSPERILLPEGDGIPGFFYGFQGWDQNCDRYTVFSFVKQLLASEMEGGLYPELLEFCRMEEELEKKEQMEVYKAYLMLMPALTAERTAEKKEKIPFSERIKKHGDIIGKALKVVLGISAMAMACVAIPVLWTEKIYPVIESAYLVKTIDAESGLMESYSGRVEIKDPENGKILKKGVLEEGKLSGYGTEYYQSGLVRYEGEFKAGEYSGEGIMYDSLGNLLYKGGFLAGVYEGTGTLYGIQGSVVYQGEFARGRKEGEGSLYDSEGNLIYEGGFKSDRLHGTGVRFDNGQAVEKGEYEDGLLVTGNGFFYDEDGLVCYEGGISEGYRQGEGIDYEKGNMVYEGSFVRNRYEGSGRLYSGETGDLLYTGEFEQGLFCGEGTLYEPGTGYIKYQGNFRKGLYDGDGLEYDASGNLMYEGSFRLGVYNGNGIFYDTFTGIPILEGIFRNGMLVTSAEKLKELEEEKAKVVPAEEATPADAAKAESESAAESTEEVPADEGKKGPMVAEEKG